MSKFFPEPLEIPISEPFLPTWIRGFADNEYQNIVERTFRDFATDIDRCFVPYDKLTTNMVRGCPFRVPLLSVVSGMLSVDINLVPPRYRIVGMEIIAVNGATASEAAAGVRADPVSFQLVAYPTGTIDALVDEKSTTTTTVKAHLVRTSGTNEQKLAQFELLILEDHSYLKGEVVKYVFPNGETRLLEWRANSVGSPNPTPTGLDTDPYYAPYSALSPSAVTRAEFDLLYDRVDGLADVSAYTNDRLQELEGNQYVDFRSQVQPPQGGLITPGDRLSFQLLGNTVFSLKLPATKNLTGLLFRVGLPLTATEAVVVNLTDVGTLDNAKTPFALLPGEWRLIAKRASGSTTSAYTTVERGVSTDVPERSTTVISFEQEADYKWLSNGTYTFSTANKRRGVVVTARLGVNCTEPTIPAGFDLIEGAFVAGRRNIYYFFVGPTAIEYVIKQLAL